jgi:hypothetical protein
MTDYKHEVRRPTDYNNGQVWGWNGGDCPVHLETEVRAWRRNLGLPILWQAKLISWRHDYGDADIIAFQVVKQHVDPKVIWVNETKGVVYEAYTSEEAARRTVYHSTTRIAVKYVEVKE